MRNDQLRRMSTIDGDCHGDRAPCSPSCRWPQIARSRVAIVSFVTALLAACASTPALDATHLQELGQHLTRSVCPGPPANVVSVPNRHVTGYIDRIEVRTCSKGSSELYVGERASNPQGLAMSVEITAPDAGLPQWLEIGRPLTRALRVLG